MKTWEKITAAIAILVMGAICVAFLVWYNAFSKKHSEEKLQAQIIELANQDLEIQGDFESLELIDIEQVGWAKYECYNYVLTTTSHRYWIGVMRNEKEIHFVDVVSVTEKENNQ